MHHLLTIDCIMLLTSPQSGWVQTDTSPTGILVFFAEV